MYLTPRDAAQAAFLDAHGWAGAEQKMIAGDASNRSYRRLRKASGETCILMDAPPDTGERIDPFANVTDILRKMDLSAPQIYASTSDQGFMLLEDLSDAVFARVIEHDPTKETLLYETAIDVLLHIHTQPAPDIETYDAALMTDRAALAFDWYRKGSLGQVNTSEKQAVCDCLGTHLQHLNGTALALAQRDYHAENLIWLPDRAGIARVGLLDYQDALLCHPAYDVVSILQDARRDLSPGLEDRMRQRYVDGAGLDPDGFERAYVVLGIQRNLRILGVFARLCMAAKKPHYVDMIPRVWSHLERDLNHPSVLDLKRLVLQSLPNPTPQILDILKSQCDTPSPR